MESIKELIGQLNITDECTTIEAKRGGAIHKSVLETVCAFANEPALGGGYILLGVELDVRSLFPYYVVTGIQQPDKLQLDLATQCASMFNQPIRPEIEIEKLPDGKLVMKVFVPELPDGQKPLYFKNDGLPKGAFRRIGSSDQTCTDDDLFIFYNREDTFDSAIVKDSSIEDISEEALSLYRKLRSNVNAYAEELTYKDEELLQSLGCIKKEKGEWHLTYTGLLVFGKRQALRRILPMVRVDYIRVPGNEWVPDPETRFTTIDMRGPLIELVQRTFSAIADDLPKGFLLPEGQLQAESIGLPSKVLREAIVNVFIHCTYRENQPIQVIRYGNRIEIKNPGFSLKPEDQLGEPGSKNRNPFIAAIFHETNLAETKGSGIRTMRSLMEKAGMAPPTFESDHGANQFTIRLLLHHFLSEDDISWLRQFNDYELTDAQKRSLIFIREAGAIDNSTFRQINGTDVIKSSSELRILRDTDLLHQKGKGRYTYYVPGKILEKHIRDRTTPPIGQTTLPIGQITPPLSQITPPHEQITLPARIKQILDSLGKKSTQQEMEDSIIAICKWKPHTLEQLAHILGRDEKHLSRTYIKPLREQNKIQYTIPDMPNHPQQAYKAE